MGLDLYLPGSSPCGSIYLLMVGVVVVSRRMASRSLLILGDGRTNGRAWAEEDEEERKEVAGKKGRKRISLCLESLILLFIWL